MSKCSHYEDVPIFATKHGIVVGWRCKCGHSRTGPVSHNSYTQWLDDKWSDATFSKEKFDRKEKPDPRTRWMLRIEKKAESASAIIRNPTNKRPDKWTLKSEDKIDTALLFAFQTSEGPFDVRVWFYGVAREETSLSKTEIMNLSKWEEVSVIYLYNPAKERRWHQRAQ